jgi:two-component system, NtrC family, sensor kinase
MARGNEQMTQTLDDAIADPRQTIAELQRQLDECRAELAARNSEYGERIAHQAASNDVLKAMSASPGDPQPVFDLITHRAWELCNANGAALYGFDGELIHLLSAYGTAWTTEREAAYRRQFPVAPTRGASFGRAILERQIVHIRDFDTDPEVAQYVRDLGVRSAVGVPLLRDGMVIGAIALNAKEPGGLSDGQVALLETFAEQAIIAIGSAETHRALQQRTGDLQESLEYQTATSDVLKVISRSTFDLQPVLDTVCETGARLCEADGGAISIREGKGRRVVATFSLTSEWDAFMRGRLFPLDRGTVTGRTMLGGHVVHVHDVASDPEYSMTETTVTLGKNRTALGVPLLREGVVIGSIGLVRQRVQPFTERQIELVRTFADQAVIAIENARLITETREALELQTATAEVLQVINSSPGNLAPVFEAMLDKALHLCEAAFGTLTTFDGNQMQLAATRGVPAAFADFIRHYRPTPAGGTIAGQILAGASLVHNIDLMAEEIYTAGDPVRRATVDLAGARSSLAVPLLRDDAVRGFIHIYRQEVRPFTEKQIALLQNFAAQAVIAIENARLLTETREALERQTATAEILRVISSSPTDIQPTFDAIARAATMLCGAASGGVYRFDGSLIHFIAHHGWTADELDAVQGVYPISPGSGSLTARAILTREVAHVADIAADPEFPQPSFVQVGFHTVLSVPMLRDGNPIGAITVTRKEIELFSDKQIDLLKTFADQAVIAIENVRLFNELSERTGDLQESLEYQTATSDVLKVISGSSFNIHPVFETIVETAGRLCDADGGWITNRGGEAHRVAATYAQTPEYDAFARGRSFPASRGTVFGRAALQGRIVHVHDVASDPEFTLTEAVTLGKYRTCLGVPLLREGVVVGVIALGRQRVQPYTDRQVELVRTFADQAVIALENARLLGELQQRTDDLQESLEYQTATSDVLKVISRSTSDVQPVLDTVVETAARLCAADTGTISIREGENYRSVASSFSAAEPEYWAIMRQRTIVPGRDSIPARVALEGRVVHVADIRADPDYAQPETVASGRRTMLGVPLLRQGEVLGTINLARKRVEPFTERQIELVRTFADQAVIAMENARLLSELQARTRDLEESLEYQTATSDVLKVISGSTFDIQPVFETIVETAGRLCGADGGLITTRDGEAYRVAATFAQTPEYDAFMRGRLLTADRGNVTGRTALEGQIVHIYDLASDPEFTLTEAVTLGKRRTAIGVPLLRDGVVVGTINLGRTRVQPFTERQIELVRTFADQAVIALENSRLITETREALEQQTATAEVLQVINSSPGDLAPVFEAMLEKATRLCEAETGHLLRFEHGEFSRAASVGVPEDFDKLLPLNTPLPRDIHRDSITYRMAASRSPVHVHDAREDESYRLGAPAEVAAVEAGIRTALFVPLLKEAEVVGCFVMHRMEVRAFTDKQIALLQSFAAQAVIAMENARLLGELQARTRDLEESLEYQTATSDVLNVISRSTADVQPVLDTVTETAARLCGADTGAMLMREGEAYRYVSLSTRAAEPGFWAIQRQRTFVPGSDSITGRVALEGKVVHVADILADPDSQFPKLWRPAGVPNLECRCCARAP